jgi:methylase of polypeptide subunit release factors
MDKKELQKKLNKPYSTDNWREVVQFVFPNVQILNPPMVIPIDNEKVESFTQLGNVQLHDGKSLALFELKLKANVNIIRNRVELNNIVSQYIDQDQTHGVLSIFEQGGDDYRFTFSARASEFDEDEGDFIIKKTDTKRFTYVLGKNESCKTPAQRFYELSENKSKAEIKDIENAFSVEKLSKAFFKEYKDQYTAFVNYMMQTPGIFKTIYNGDDKAVRDFVKILLGRIIFIKFVQKKGWMGVDASSKKWIDGDYRFLENGFTNFKHQDLFYSTFLEPLFEALDEPNRPNDIFTVTKSRVPYLSGGLFELEDKKTKNINFPVKYFADLFEFLDRYNFTIDENDTNDHEVGIDPEMLGHIFENLLEDNKDKGAFYTPKEIVRYMCQESLKEYLKTSLENNKQWPTDETKAAAFEQALHNFVTKKEAGGIIEFEETIARALKDVKICDPAIGSGAFPMGLLNEIFQLVHKLHEANRDKVERVWELNGWQPNLVKQNIIQNSIYGVDIEKGAVDVARLRFWLSLIVDEPEPKALPHLDYKIVVGNSLVSKLDDTVIDIDWNLDETQHGLFGSELAQERAAILQKISDKQKAVFDPNSNEEKLSLEIRNLKIDLLIKQLELMINKQNIPKEPKIADYQNKTKAKFAQDQAKYFETVGWKNQIKKLEKLKTQPKEALHFFDWKLDFPEIMNEQVTDKVGFDIVIGNPPYVTYKGKEKVNITENELKKIIELHPNSAEYKINSYALFIESGLRLLSKNSNINYIIPGTILQNEYLKNIRKHLILDNNILKIVTFGNKVFNAVTDSIILIATNKINEHNQCSFIRKTNLDFKINEEKLYSTSIWNNREDYIINLKTNNLEDFVLTKIETNSEFIEDYLEVYVGIVAKGIKKFFEYPLLYQNI